MQGTHEIKLQARTKGIAAACTLCTIAFLALAAYLGLLNVVSPAVAALLTAAGVATFGATLPAAVNWSVRRRERQRASNPFAGLEDILARQADPALAELVRRHPDGTVAATFLVGIAAGYSRSVRRTLEGILEELAKSERERASGSE